MSNKEISIIAMSTAIKGQEKALRALQLKLVEGTLKEPGCIRYELQQSLDDERVTIFVEVWESEESWIVHKSAAAMKEYEAAGARQMVESSALFRLDILAGTTR